jgi:hypothetical protein
MTKKSEGRSPHFRLHLYRNLIKKTVERKGNILLVDHLQCFSSLGNKVREWKNTKRLILKEFMISKIEVKN